MGPPRNCSCYLCTGIDAKAGKAQERQAARAEIQAGLEEVELERLETFDEVHENCVLCDTCLDGVGEEW